MGDGITVGLIGAGRIGRLHAQHLASRIPGVDLRAVADIDLKAARACAVRCRVAVATAHYEEILDDEAIDAVVICSSTDTHTRIIEDAAVAGKQIFCEKPIDIDLERIDHVLDVVGREGVIFQVGFNRRFDPNFRRVRELIAGGAVGDVHLLHIISRDPAPPPLSYIRASGGIFLDMTIHDFDMARYLVGSEVTEIYAMGEVRVDSAIGDAGDLDTVLVTLRFANGVIGTIDNSRQAVYGYDQRVEVFGGAGAVRVGNDYPNTAILSDSESVRRDLPLNFFMERYTEAYVAEMEAFIGAVRAGHTAPVTGRDGRLSVIMGLAAQRSCEQNRPVALSEVAPDLLTSR
jgi:myo-inositol 2-dehydrogenase/D-chiro-inositol 1-dehydrogenase